ncbi:MAG: WavE lipopolysaccharide synthesis family protein [Sphingobacteriaceae bacterium]|nr:WavE lipopolysaccharide synthesis family protein [Sphingobacteriaceae bacterium]
MRNDFKTTCVIQGNIRLNANLVIQEMLKHFDWVILSTWQGEDLSSINAHEKLIILENEKPIVPGYSHRNYQRYTTAQGLRKAKELHSDYVLKWRTDMLPLKLNVNDLISKSQYKPMNGLSRIVTCVFRCMTIEQDDFSSIPDLFAFGHIDMMEMLWGDDYFDYSSQFNIPTSKLTEVAVLAATQGNVMGYYCSETELYCLFKDKLNTQLGVNFQHEYLLKNFFYLFNHADLDILWFGHKTGRYRSIFVYGYPWWSRAQWLGKQKIIKSPITFSVFYSSLKIKQIRIINFLFYLKTNFIQSLKYNTYVKKNNLVL